MAAEAVAELRRLRGGAPDVPSEGETVTKTAL